MCSFLEGPLPGSGPGQGSGGAREKGGGLLSLCTSRRLKTRFQCVLASCLHGDWENLQVLKKSYLQIYLFLKFLLKTLLYVI